MIITELHRKRRSFYEMELDEELAVMVDVRTFDESPYKVGSTLSDEQLMELLNESEKRRAKEKALYLLSLRDHSRKELERKLRREANEETAAETASRMEELGLINDEQYGRRLADELKRRKYYPGRRIVQELCVRGLNRDSAQLIVDEMNFDDVQQALALIRKKYYNKLNDETSRRKTAAALSRFGFSNENIRRAIEEWQTIEQEKIEYGY